MGWKRKVSTAVGVVIGLVVVAGVGIWIWKPWVPPVVVADPGRDGRRITDKGLIANYYPGKGAGPRPAILLLGGSEGGLGDAVTKQARALAAEGYGVLNLSYFRAPGQSEKLERVPLETFDRGLAWLKAQPDVDGGRIAVVGGSKGAEAALLIATRHKDLKAIVAAMPSSVAWAGFDWNTFGSTSSSWSEAGKDVPFLQLGPYDYSVGTSSVYLAGLKALPQRPDVVIPIERSTAPVLLICGEMDSLWPSCPMARQVVDRARAAGGPVVTLLAYPDAGHAVFGLPRADDDPAIEQLGGLGGSGAGNNAARKQAWPQMLAFLRAALGN
jgi:dienelactone hydrolase